jgi:hypothetical protein
MQEIETSLIVRWDGRNETLSLCVDGSWVALAQDCVHRWALVLVMLTLGLCYHSCKSFCVCNSC